MKMRIVRIIPIVTLLVVSFQLPASAQRTSKNRKSLNRDPCSIAKNPCSNRGTCVTDADAKHGYACRCTEGFHGDLCTNRNNGCAGVDCQNGGVCFDISSGYICICAAGFSGQQCQNGINECASNPCQNGGQCSDEPNRFTCTCRAGWKGTRCNRPCLGNPALGMESGDIPDSSITANRYKRAEDFDRLPHYARLNGERFWAAYISQDPWIQVDLQAVTNVYGIMTQGDDGKDVTRYKYWIPKLRVQTGTSVEDLTTVLNENGTEIFDANTGPATTATIYWPMPIATRFIRIIPEECLRDGSRGTCVLKFEVLGSGCS